MSRGVAQRRRPDRGRLGIEHRGQPGRRHPQQEGELPLDRIVGADHPVFEDAAVELVDDLARVGAGPSVDQQRRRLAQRGGAGRIAAEILDDAGANQLDRHGDLLDLVFAQQLPHHPAGEHAILAQRAPHLGEVIGRGGLRRAAGGVAAPIGGGLLPAMFAPSGASVGERAQQRKPSPPISSPRMPSKTATIQGIPCMVLSAAGAGGGGATGYGCGAGCSRSRCGAGCGGSGG